MEGKEKRYRVLIVEDELIIALALQMALERNGFSVIGKTVSGEEAIEMTLKHKPDVVLMDIILKGKMNGMDAALTIWEKTNSHVIFTTGNKRLLDAIDSKKEFDALSKPVENNVLFDIIRRHCE